MSGWVCLFTLCKVPLLSIYNRARVKLFEVTLTNTTGYKLAATVSVLSVAILCKALTIQQWLVVCFASWIFSCCLMLTIHNGRVCSLKVLFLDYRCCFLLLYWCVVRFFDTERNNEMAFFMMYLRASDELSIYFPSARKRWCPLQLIFSDSQCFSCCCCCCLFRRLWY